MSSHFLTVTASSVLVSQISLSSSMSHFSSDSHNPITCTDDFNEAQTLCAVIGALDVLSNAFRQAQDSSVTTGFTLLNATLSPDLVKYLIFASSFADNFVKGDDLSRPISDDAIVESFATEDVPVDPTYSPAVTTCLSHEQSYPEAEVGTPSDQWLEGSVDQDYTERSSSASPGDPTSPVVSDDDSPQEFASGSSPLTPYSPFQSPTYTFGVHPSVDSNPEWQNEFATGSIAYVQDSGTFSPNYQSPNYIPDNANCQQQQCARVQWLAENHEQISRDLGKSPLFSPFMVNHPRSPTPTYTDHYLRYSANSSIYHPRPVKNPNFPLRQLLCYSPSIAPSSRYPPPVAYVSVPGYLRSNFSPDPSAGATEFI